MFSRVNPLGWALFEELTSAQMNLLDLNASRAIDGTFGGTYNPSGPININGTLNVTNLVFTGGTVDNLTVTYTLDGNIINCNEINIASEMNCNGVALLNDTVYFYDNAYFVGTGTNFYFYSGGTFDFTNGIFLVQNGGLARFASDVDFTNDCTVVVQTNCDWTFNNWPVFQTGLRAYGSNLFYTAPAFYEGLSIAAGKLITYSTPQSWIIRFPFVLGGQVTSMSSSYDIDSSGFCKQIANSSWPIRLWSFPQGLWGKTPVDIIAAEFYARANGLSGMPTGDTQFRIFKIDHYWNPIGSAATANDSNPNNSTDHYVPWSGTITLDPSTEIFGLVFLGYNGGDTLGGSKWYEIKSVRMTLRTNARGLY
ncbi:MAG: hypothetical protein WC565_01830 [Parcubacteria group bacterium]